VKTRIATISRIMFILPFGIFGVMHLLHAQEMADKVPAWIPGGTLWVYITGLAFIAACVGVLTGIQRRLAFLGLAFMLVTFILTVHLPALAGGDAHSRPMTMMLLLKDISLLAGALTYSWMS
jgi:putative oxidoreductase